MTTCKVILDETGHKYKDFKLEKIVEVKGLNCTLRELVHEPTGARVMHIANDDPENVFCLSFRTLPHDSTGVAHILEHTVLCGSAKYPVKDPFFSMNRRSLNTFMNAFTGSDFTCYPAASQVEKDFYNLLEVYLDSAFKPLLKELSFAQEGHRLEFSEADNKDSSILFKGVVFNEMKGSYVSPTARLWKALHAELFPDITYSFDSGGDPKEIPTLTHQGLVDFHRQHYHPSRCLFYFYGDIPLEKHLDFLAEKTLNGIEKLDPLSDIPLQKRFKKPVVKTLPYPIAPDKESTGQTMVSMSFLTCHILEQQELLALSVIDLLLMANDASPLKVALLESKLCTQASSFLEEDISEIPWVLILKGCEEENAQKLHSLVTETLQKVLEDGFPQDRIEAAIHQIEFYRREITGDTYPFGLSLFMRAGLLKQHGGKPEDSLKIDSIFKELREHIQDPQYLLGIMKKYFIDNTHLACITMVPNKNIAMEECEEEHKRLETIQKKLSDKEKEDIIKQTQSLARLQEKQNNDLEVLPKVSLKDVPKKAKEFPLTQEAFDKFTLYHHDCFSNGILYADVIFDMPTVKEDELSLSRLFSMWLSQVGCGGRNYKETLDYIEENTGGIGAALSLHPQANDCDVFKPSFSLHGKTLYRKMDRLFPLMVDMIQTPDFSDINRLKELLLKLHTNLEQSLNSNAMKYATNFAVSGITKSGRIGNLWSGLDFYWFVKDLVKNFDGKANEIVERFQEMHSRMTLIEGAHLVLSGDEKMVDELKKEEFFGFGDLPMQTRDMWKPDLPVKEIKSQCRIIPSPVAFTALAIPGVAYTDSNAAALSAAAMIFDNRTLHKRIREQGGAYGSGAVNNTSGSSFYFYTYRDPHIASSLAAVQEAVRDVVENKFEDRELEEAKLGIIQSLDSPIPPESRAFTSYCWKRGGKPISLRQQYRDRVINLNREDVIAAVQQKIQPYLSDGVIVSFVEKELAEKENLSIEKMDFNALEILSV